MTEREFEKMVHIRTAYSSLSVASLALNQIKHNERQEKKRQLSLIEQNIDNYLNKLKLSVFKREGKGEFEKMEKEFEEATDFMNCVIAISSIIPNHPTLHKNILDGFKDIVEVELKKLNDNQNK